MEIYLELQSFSIANLTCIITCTIISCKSIHVYKFLPMVQCIYTKNKDLTVKTDMMIKLACHKISICQFLKLAYVDKISICRFWKLSYVDFIDMPIFRISTCQFYRHMPILSTYVGFHSQVSQYFTSAFVARNIKIYKFLGHFQKCKTYPMGYLERHLHGSMVVPACLHSNATAPEVVLVKKL